MKRLAFEEKAFISFLWSDPVSISSITTHKYVLSVTATDHDVRTHSLPLENQEQSASFSYLFLFLSSNFHTSH